MNSAGRLALWAFAALAATAPAREAAAQSPAAALAPAVGPPDRAGVFAGGGVLFLQPYFQNNLAYTVFAQQTVDPTLDANNPTTRTAAEAARRVEVRHHMVAAPLAWLGYMGADGWGVRVRGWGFEEGTGQTAVLPPFAGQFRVGGTGGQTVVVTNGPLVTASSAAPLGLQAFADTLSVKYGPEAALLAVTTKLQVTVGDVEAVRRYRGADWDVILSGGLRVARLDQTYNAYNAQTGSPTELRSLTSTYNVRGVGPTLAVDARRPLCECGLSAYGQCRGALVFGAADQDATFSGLALRNDDPNPQTASQSRDRAIPIVELGLGLEYGRTVGCNRLSGRVGVVGQQWFNAGGASRSTALSPAGTLRPVLGGAPLDSNLSFLGLTLEVGLDF